MKRYIVHLFGYPEPENKTGVLSQGLNFEFHLTDFNKDEFVKTAIRNTAKMNPGYTHIEILSIKVEVENPSKKNSHYETIYHGGKWVANSVEL